MRPTLAVLALALPLSAPATTFETALRDGAASLLAGHAKLAANAAVVSHDPARCRPEPADGERLYSNDFRWNYTLPELVARFTEIYPTPKRLPKRAYWSAEKQRFEFPYLDMRGGAIELPETFVANIGRHIQSAYASNYIDGVFFPDMGHSHFLIPQALWTQRYSGRPSEQMSRMMEDLFKDPALEVFYHTAEQLKTREEDGALVADPRTKFRYETRNIAGRNDGSLGLKVLQNPESRANTVHEVPGYFWWGGGFNISANANGCFAVKAGGRELRFDLSMFDLESKPGTGMEGFGMGDRRGSGPSFGDCESLRSERLERRLDGLR